MSASTTSTSSSRRIIQPIPLTSAQEGEIQKIYTKNVRAKCVDEIAEFAKCAKGHMVSVNFTCSDQKLAMNSCLRRNGTLSELDGAREEWHTTRVQKKKQAAEEEEKHVKKVLADRAQLDAFEARMKVNEPKKSSWWPFGSSGNSSTSGRENRSPESNSKGNG